MVHGVAKDQGIIQNYKLGWPNPCPCVRVKERLSVCMSCLMYNKSTILKLHKITCCILTLSHIHVDALDPVGDLWENKTTSTLSWTPPPSLDLTNVDPDIAYFVDVYNITCGMRDHIISDCNVTEPSYTRRVAGDRFIYEHVITPRSNVPEASNGTSQSLKGYKMLALFPGSPSPFSLFHTPEY